MRYVVGTDGIHIAKVAWILDWRSSRSQSGLGPVIHQVRIGVGHFGLEAVTHALFKRQLERVVSALPVIEEAPIDDLVLRPRSQRLGDASVEARIRCSDPSAISLADTVFELGTQDCTTQVEH